MRNLFDFLRKYNYWFLFLLLEVLSCVLLFRYNSYQGSVWLTSANALTIQVERIYGDVRSFLDLRQVNSDLTQRNVALERELAVLRDELQRVGHDSLGISDRMRAALEGYRQIPAKVLSNSINKTDNYIVLDKGEADGVRSEMGVVGGGGIVGIVCQTEQHYSLVIPLLHSRSNISCRVRGCNFFGYLQWEGGNPLRAVMTDVPRYAKLHEGDCVETSGFSSVFPPGMFVGRIMQITNSNDGLSYRLVVNLGTAFANLRDVCIIENNRRGEIDSLRVRAFREKNEMSKSSKK